MSTVNVYIEKIDDVWAQIRSDSRGLLRSIYDRFTIDSEANAFVKKNNPHWDGNLHLFRSYNQTMYIGLLPELVEYLYEEFGDDVAVHYNKDHVFGHEY